MPPKWRFQAPFARLKGVLSGQCCEFRFCMDLWNRSRSHQSRKWLLRSNPAHPEKWSIGPADIPRMSTMFQAQFLPWWMHAGMGAVPMVPFPGFCSLAIMPIQSMKWRRSWPKRWASMRATSSLIPHRLPVPLVRATAAWTPRSLNRLAGVRRRNLNRR